MRALRSCMVDTSSRRVSPRCAISLPERTSGRTPITSEPPARAASATAPIRPTLAPPYTMPNLAAAIDRPNALASARYASSVPSAEPQYTATRAIVTPSEYRRGQASRQRASGLVLISLSSLVYDALLGSSAAFPWRHLGTANRESQEVIREVTVYQSPLQRRIGLRFLFPAVPPQACPFSGFTGIRPKRSGGEPDGLRQSR